MLAKIRRRVGPNCEKRTVPTVERTKDGGLPVFLYVFDHEGWAIHQVGKTWQAAIQDLATFEMMPLSLARKLPPRRLSDYRDTVLGYSAMLDGRGYKGRCPEDLRVQSNVRATYREVRLKSGLFYDRTAGADKLRRGLAVLHDPIEIFPQSPDWRSFRPDVSRLRRFSGVAVTTNELAAVLRKRRIGAVLVPTLPDVLVREDSEVVMEPARPISICSVYPRKDVPLLMRVAERWNGVGGRAPFTPVLGRSERSRAEYQSLLDRHNVYVCTSWQEGGPLPLMEAVCRGHAVVTTSVGSVDRWVKHGENGFICRSEDDFVGALEKLDGSPRLLQRMRRASLSVARQRAHDPVRSQVSEFLRLPVG